MPFFSISGSDLVEMFVGVGASCVRVIAAAKAGGQTRQVAYADTHQEHFLGYSIRHQTISKAT